jgi:spore maturation protein CgeB
MPEPLKITILGLSITSSWGNGHATTFRGLVRELNRRGHHITFLERDVPWYAEHRDLPIPPYCDLGLYQDLEELRERFERDVVEADCVIVGSYVPEGVDVATWVNDMAKGVTAFYDIDTPVTLAKLRRGDYEYISPELIPRYNMYLSFTGGPTLHRLQEKYKSPKALPLYCSFDPDNYFPEKHEIKWDLGYLGTYSDDRQPPLERLMLDAARSWPEGRFAVAGPQYPETIEWPVNVERFEHLPPNEHCAFYCSQRFAMNITRADMIEAGYSPSVRLFEAAACGVPVISDFWEGLDSFFTIGEDILVSRSATDTLSFLCGMSEHEREQIGRNAREKVMSKHTAAHRAGELERYILKARHGQSPLLDALRI